MTKKIEQANYLSVSAALGLEDGAPVHPIIKLPDVCKVTLLSKSTIYKMVKNGLFPAPIKLGLRATVWRVEEVEAWLNSCKPA